MVQHYRLLTKTHLGELAIVLDWLNQICQTEISRDVLIQCQTILAEAFTNAVRHAHRDLDMETPIEIEAGLDGHWLELRVWDLGPAFELNYLLHNSQLTSPDAVGGRGIHLIAQLTDRSSYERIEDKRNCLLMVKQYLPNQTYPSNQTYPYGAKVV